MSRYEETPDDERTGRTKMAEDAHAIALVAEKNADKAVAWLKRLQILGGAAVGLVLLGSAGMVTWQSLAKREAVEAIEKIQDEMRQNLTALKTTEAQRDREHQEMIERFNKIDDRIVRIANNRREDKR